MSRDTSIDAYNSIQETGVLGKRQWEIYDMVFRKGPMTANEAFREVALESGKKAGTLLSVSNARFTELRESGLFKELGTRRCTVSGRNVILWDVTSNLPVSHEKPKRTKCTHCDGKGYLTTRQGKLF